jgi:hypothetical protein
MLGKSTRKSAEGREHLLVRWEPAGRLLGVGEPTVNGNLEHTAAGLVQLYLRAGCLLLNQTCRRTGARFIASHSAIFDLNSHDLLSRLSPHLLTQRQPHALHVAIHRHRRKQKVYIAMHAASTRAHPGIFDLLRTIETGPRSRSDPPHATMPSDHLSRKLYVLTTAEGGLSATAVDHET